MGRPMATDTAGGSSTFSMVPATGNPLAGLPFVRSRSRNVVHKKYWYEMHNYHFALEYYNYGECMQYVVFNIAHSQ